MTRPTCGRCASGLSSWAPGRGSEEAQVRAAVKNKTGQDLDDLPASELKSLVEAAAGKLRQMQQPQAA